MLYTTYTPGIVSYTYEEAVQVPVIFDYIHDLQNKATHMHNTLSLICNFATLTTPNA